MKRQKGESMNECAEVTKTSNAIEKLKEVILHDEGLAWSWHCNIAMCMVDAGCSKKKANIGAKDFMKKLFGVDGYEPCQTR